jgi:hypothetical protein
MIKVKDVESFELFVNQMWLEGMSSHIIGELVKSDAFKDPKLVAMYLTQVYHYAVHTPRHQALVAINERNDNIKYMQYCFNHALEETGHELMALKDIQSLGYKIDSKSMPGRLPSTELMIAFLYQEAKSANPIHHLGYGFWSENACPFVNSFMESLMETNGLKRNQLTFYSSHVTIDESHAKEVRDIITNVATNDSDWEGMQRVAKITFDLTLGIVKETFEAYKNLNSSDHFNLFKN